MPFKSKSQMRRFGEMVKSGDMTQEKYDQWLKETQNPEALPERLGPPTPKGGRRIKVK